MSDGIKLGIIGGTGVYDLPILSSTDERLVRTEHGAVPVQRGIFSEEELDRELEVFFVARHGAGHRVPPHRVNYHANITAMKRLDVTHVLATTAVGSLKSDLHPGELVLLDQFIDFTRTRNYTFFDGGAGEVQHTDMTYPYDESMRQLLIDVGDEGGIELRPRGTYVCTEGPRFETAAEIKMFAALGGDVVGMTNVPEVILANEAELRYATVSLVTNYGAGIGDSPLTHEEVHEAMQANSDNITGLITGLIRRLATGESEGPGA